MRRFLSVFVAVVFALSLAGVAAAQSTQTAPSGSAPAAGGTQTDQPKSSTPSGGTGTDTGKSTADQPKGSKPGQAATDKPATGKTPARAAMARGQHKMMGEVTKIDAAKGMVSVKTDEGDMDLHFPPSALQGIKEGDRVEVQLAIRPAAGGAASKSSDQMGKSKVPASKSPTTKPGEQPKTQ